MKKTLFILTLAALLGAVPASAQVDFTRYVALGDSLTAGYVSGALAEPFQERSYPAMFAYNAGVTTFEMPLVSMPGIGSFGTMLELNGLVPAPAIAPMPGLPGSPINAEYPAPYNNLGVPGSNTYDFLNTTGDIMNLAAGNLDNVMHDLILRFPYAEGPAGPIPATAVVQAIALDPTFVTFWMGNNDILGAAIYATPIDGVTMTPIPIFEQLYGQALGALATMTSAEIVVMNLPYATALPYVTTVSNYITIPDVGTVQLMGEDGPIGDDDYITLGASSLIAQGYGLPGFPPLPENIDPATGAPGVILRAEEAAIISERYDVYNQIIAATAANFGVSVIDANALFDDLDAHGWTLGGVTLDTGFLQGGIFSYDGIHPQNIGYAWVASGLIDFVNEHYGMSIPQVNMEQVLCHGGCAGQGVPPGTDPSKVLFTDAAQEGLMRLFPANLPTPEPVDSGTTYAD